MVRLIKGQHVCEASLWVAGCFGHAFSMKLSVFQRNGCINFVFYCHTLSHIYIQMTTKKGSVGFRGNATSELEHPRQG